MSKILELKNLLKEKHNKDISRTRLEKILRQEAFDNNKSYIDVIYMYLRNETARLML